jgi:CheY-like chemotaxis protein
MHDLHILVAEDHEFARHLLVRALNDLGVKRVTQSRDGAEALALARVDRPDIVISDLQMPGMDGMTFITHVAREHLADSLIIQSGLTQNVLKAVEAVAVTSGLRVLGAVEKPLSRDAISALLYAHANPGAAPARLDAAAVERAAALRQFKAWFSPVLDVSTMQVVAAEASLRWESPERGPFTGRESLQQVIDPAAMPAVCRAVVASAFATGGLWKQMQWPGTLVVDVDDLLGVPDFWSGLFEFAKKNGVNGAVSLGISGERFAADKAGAAFALARAAMDGFQVTLQVNDAAAFEGFTAAASCNTATMHGRRGRSCRRGVLRTRACSRG